MKFQDFILQAKNMQEQMQLQFQEFTRLQQEVAKNEYTGSARDEMVRVCVNGFGEVMSIYIDPELFREHPELVGDLIKEATNSANDRVRRTLDDLINLLNKLFMYRGLDR